MFLLYSLLFNELFKEVMELDQDVSIGKKNMYEKGRLFDSYPLKIVYILINWNSLGNLFL